MASIRPPRSRSRVVGIAVLALGLVGTFGQSAHGQAAAPRAQATGLAVVRIEPLGLDAERALRLEMLFRHELERLAGTRMPSKGRVERLMAKDATLAGCTAEVRCLTEIGHRLGVKHVVSGNVGEMGDSYVINLKLVDAVAGTEVRRIQEPLRGARDELIEAVRVAAYRLAAPEQLLGGIELLSDVNGARIFLDGKSAGTTPLTRPIERLTVGQHTVRITAPGYTDFLAKVEVRFQKTTQVIVRMVVAVDPGGRPAPGGPRAPARVPWYATKWAYVGAGVGAVAIGVLVGVLISPSDEVVRCDMDPTACVP